MSIFGIIFVLICAVATYLFYIVLSHSYSNANDDADLEVYKAQLSHIDNDTARGVISPSEATDLKTEIARRILAIDAITHQGVRKENNRFHIILACIIFVLLSGGGYFIYIQHGAPGYANQGQKDRIENSEHSLENRPSQNEILKQQNVSQDINTPQGEHGELVIQLRKTLKTRPNDIEGLVLLTGIETRLGNFAQAITAQSQIIALKQKNGTINAKDHFDLADILITQANGIVSPQAEIALNNSRKLKHDYGGTLYYLGLMYLQHDRPDQAFKLWRKVLNDAHTSDAWLPIIHEQMPQVVALAGIVNYSMPPLPTKNGPSAEDIEAFSNLSTDEQNTAITAMVDRLSNQLATSGGPIEDWMKLINALTILKQTQKAHLILKDAKNVFQSDPFVIRSLTEFAREIGLEQ